jgi:GNAT superfamily N-acetyltransferase
VSIIDVERAHLPAVSRLLAELGYNIAEAELARRLQAFAGQPAHRLLLSEDAGEIVGFMHAYARPALHKPPEVVVQAIVVAAAARGRGIGKALLAEAEQWARHLGFGSVSLYSHVRRDDAFRIYLALGYGHIGTSHALRKAVDT